MTVLVTGATGLVGNNVVRLLLERGQAVRVLIRPHSDPRPLEGLDVERVTGDIRSQDDVTSAMHGVRAVVHAAAHLHLGHAMLELSTAINVEGTRHMVHAARQVGARMVHISSVDALGVGTREQLASEEEQFGDKADSTYVRTKRAAESVILEALEKGLDAVIVNPGFVAGPWDWKPSSGRMLLAVCERFTMIAPTGGVCVTDARDVASGILAALEQGKTGRRYILAGQPMSYYDLWQAFADISARRGPWFRMGPVLRWVAGVGGDVLGKITGSEPDVNSAAMQMSSQFHYYTSQRAIDELGFRCRPPRESLEAAWQWFRDYGYL